MNKSIVVLAPKWNMPCRVCWAPVSWTPGKGKTSLRLTENRDYEQVPRPTDYVGLEDRVLVWGKGRTDYCSLRYLDCIF